VRAHSVFEAMSLAAFMPTCSRAISGRLQDARRAVDGVDGRRRAIAFREGNQLRFLSIAPDHDATYGRK
jgi:hypothetical protein